MAKRAYSLPSKCWDGAGPEVCRAPARQIECAASELWQSGQCWSRWATDTKSPALELRLAGISGLGVAINKRILDILSMEFVPPFAPLELAADLEGDIKYGRDRERQKVLWVHKATTSSLSIILFYY